jgi:hypothetical protein
MSTARVNPLWSAEPANGTPRGDQTFLIAAAIHYEMRGPRRRDLVWSRLRDGYVPPVSRSQPRRSTTVFFALS